jgi:AraC-like DNA-binding protein
MYSWLHHHRSIADYLARFWYELLIPVQLAFYLVLACRRIHLHEERIRAYFSTIDGLSLRGLWMVVIAFGIGLVGLAAGSLLLLAGVELEWTFLCAPVANIVAVYVLFWLSYGEKNQPEITQSFPGPQAIPETGTMPVDPVAKSDPNLEKYQKDQLPSEFCNRILVSLERVMANDKPYLSPCLDLASLSELAHTTRNHLSQVLNQKLGSSFYDYVNRYRIQEVAARLVVPDHQERSIFDIAIDCGFNSKSTFNKTFRHWYGVSPSEYRQGIRCPMHAGVEGDRGIPVRARDRNPRIPNT